MQTRRLKYFVRIAEDGSQEGELLRVAVAGPLRELELALQNIPLIVPSHHLGIRSVLEAAAVKVRKPQLQPTQSGGRECPREQHHRIFH